MHLRECTRSRDQDSVPDEGSVTIPLITTQLNSLSTAIDNSDNHPTTSKFPKTRPLEFISKQDENGQEIALIANYVKILAAPKCIKLKKIRREILAIAGIKDVTFDGTILYSFEDFGTRKLASAKYPVTNELIPIKMKRTATASQESPEFFHLTNLIVLNLDKELAGLTGRFMESESRTDKYNQLDAGGSRDGRMHVDSPQMIELPNDRSEAFIHIIGNSASPRVDLVCCILTNNRKDCYDAI
ncbi:unnamed protein product, partial [Rotaria magnacalcarata]